MEINIGNALTDQLGLSGFSVLGGNVDFDAIDGALDRVLSQMSMVGAQTNRLGYSINALETASYNQEVARSRQEDADMAQSAMNAQRERLTQDVGISMQRLMMQGMGNFLRMFA
jgi:flagellin-like hook-associated protein FlgL